MTIKYKGVLNMFNLLNRTVSMVNKYFEVRVPVSYTHLEQIEWQNIIDY